MLSPTQINKISTITSRFDPRGSNRYFLFGSAVREASFNDIDLGVVGNSATGAQIQKLRDQFYDSNIPYRVDVVDFDQAGKEFTDYVLTHEPIVWIR